MEPLRIAINGFGRIGRCVLRAHAERKAKDQDTNLEIVAVNFGEGDLDTYLHLLQYDSTHGFFPGVLPHGKNFSIGQGEIKSIHTRDLGYINWQDHGVDIVLECTGAFTKRESNLQHLQAGAKKVIVSAPCAGADATIIYGVNNQRLTKTDAIISIGSCTTNCLAPIAKILNDGIGIESGFMTTIHAYTKDQNLLDSRHKDLRRARAANLSMIPTSTGAAKTIGLILPELTGRLDGIAIRVPTPNVSLIDFKFLGKQSLNESEVNELVKSAIEQDHSLKLVLTTTSKELVSIDFNHNSSSGIFDLTQTKVVNNNFYRIAAWYDNEWGFSHRMLDVAALTR